MSIVFSFLLLLLFFFFSSRRRHTSCALVTGVQTCALPILFEGAAEAEYGNYDSMKGKAMVNIPLGDTMALRVAGIYLNRDGYTKNTFLNTRIDDRDLYSVRGSLRWEPTSDTTVDLLASYFHEREIGRAHI